MATPEPAPTESEIRRERADALRDAVALLELASSGDHDVEAWASTVMDANRGGLMLTLAEECVTLARELYGVDLSEWIRTLRARAAAWEPGA